MRMEIPPQLLCLPLPLSTFDTISSINIHKPKSPFYLYVGFYRMINVPFSNTATYILCIAHLLIFYTHKDQ